ncbi:Uncharacterised protein [Mycobacterium tuberculosis]|uniref:Uncharacterized protein n=1 Tax=Mycobacterium tuberculosis TaxID=1773 RepID=A0A0U0SHH8_MYCTX|nr:Uncharacterised protein [Mycobacterium tuberculosis]COW81220.1 Uncharacterised protein [Mycobacterium tuberculosis]COW98367.1 Uncharacterised protein [Mycobacterium tuberculosis]COX22541.1 Uncharacterised protein [Mycobacterium tuberculosis]COX23767.1 Uncharacterised protein [Mycobacterium tuberculosis]
MTFDPGSITKPARADSIVNCVLGVNSPRNCRYTKATTSAKTSTRPKPAVL